MNTGRAGEAPPRRCFWKEPMEYQTIIHPFEPVFDAKCRVLILGSLPSVKSRQNDFYYGLTMTSLISWYLLGAMLKKSSWKIFYLKAWQNMAMFLGVGLLCVFLNCATAYIGIKKDVFSYISPLQVVQTTFLFLFCRSLTVRKGERIITFFASSAFAGLLMHSWKGATMYGIGNTWIYANLPVPFVFSILYICLFFAIACCLDKIRIWCWKRISEKVF